MGIIMGIEPNIKVANIVGKWELIDAVVYPIHE